MKTQDQKYNVPTVPPGDMARCIRENTGDMEEFWLDLLTFLGELTETERKSTGMFVHTPVLPWIYLLECPMLYRYYRSGPVVPGYGMTKEEDFPLPEPDSCKVMTWMYTRTTGSMNSVQYLLEMDMVWNVCIRIGNLYDKMIIGETEYMHMLGEIAGVLDLMERDCEDFSTVFKVEYEYCDFFAPEEPQAGDSLFYGRDLSGATVVVTGGDRCGQPGPSGESLAGRHRISHSNAIDRLRFFRNQRQVLDHYRNGQL